MSSSGQSSKGKKPERTPSSPLSSPEAKRRRLEHTHEVDRVISDLSRRDTVIEGSLEQLREELTVTDQLHNRLVDEFNALTNRVVHVENQLEATLVRLANAEQELEAARGRIWDLEAQLEPMEVPAEEPVADPVVEAEDENGEVYD